MEFFNSVNTAIQNVLGPLGPMILVGALGTVMVVLTVIIMLRQPEDPLNKLKRDAANRNGGSAHRERLRQGGHNEQLDRFASFLEPKDVAELSAKQLQLRQAGYQSKDAVRMFHAAQMLLGLLGLGLGVFYYTFYMNVDGAEVSTQKMIMYTVGPGGIGYYLPQYWVTRRVEERKEQITQGFPDSLDMMLVCVEAGQSLEQSIVRVARELRASFPALADEFDVIAYEMKAGKDKATVLNDMGERCGVQDVASFVTVLVQSTSFGTSIADALRVYAGEMRDKRVMRAEEAANKLPTKMTLATMMLTVPPLLIILVGPSVMGITKMGSLSAGGN